MILRVSDLRLARGGRPILQGVDLSVAKGECVALMGLSGGGKTTVLRCVVALEPFDAGTIDVGGFALHPGAVPRESALRDLRLRVGLVFQLHSLFEHLNVIDNVTLAPVHVHGVPEGEADRKAIELLELLGVAHRAHALPKQLSGGEAQRVAIARSLAVEPPLLLMDEPTASLDPARRGELGRMLTRLRELGRTIVFSTHDVDFAEEFATRVVVLASGQVVEEGLPSDVLRNARTEATRQLLQATHES